MEYTDYLESRESKKYHHRIHQFIRYNINEILSDSILLWLLLEYIYNISIQQLRYILKTSNLLLLSDNYLLLQLLKYYNTKINESTSIIIIIII